MAGAERNSSASGYSGSRSRCWHAPPAPTTPPRLGVPRRTAKPAAGPQPPARVATAPAAGSVGSAPSRTSSTSVAGTANSSANAWRSPSSCFCEGQQGVPLILQQTADRSNAVGAVRLAQPQFRHDPVIQGTAADVVGAAHRQHVVLEPTDQQGHVFGEGHRLRLGLASIAELPYQRRILAALPVLGRGPGGFPDDCVWRWLRRHDSPGNRPRELPSVRHGRRHRDKGHPARPRLVRPAIPRRNRRWWRRVGSSVRSVPAGVRPAIGVAVLFRTEQVAVGRGDIGADQHRPAGLEDLVVGGRGGRQRGLAER